MLLALIVLSTTVAGETNKKVSEPLTSETINIRKDYVKPKFRGEWVYNKADDTFKWL